MAKQGINKSIFDDSVLQEPVANLLESTMSQSILSTIQQSSLSVLARADLIQIFLFQLCGMIIFTYGVTCPDSYEELDFQIAIAILLGICFSGYMSGGNFNPGVTLMNFIRKDNKITLKMVIVYLVAQILGTFIGGSLGFAYNGAMQHGFLPQQDSTGYLFKLGFGEFIGSFILVFFILHLTNPNTTYLDNQVQSYFVICLFIYIGRKFTPLSGMSLNITVSFVFAILALFESGQSDQFKYLWIYVFGDLLGSIIATLFFDRFYERLVKQHRLEKRLMK